MRIIAGSLGGRNFDAPKGKRTHPMSEKVRGGLFSVLGDINGLNLLDAFGGSGAISFEAISRGANSALTIEIDKKAHQTVVSNTKILGLEGKVKAISANVSGWSDNNPAAQFDIVVAAPPYDNLQVGLLQKLVRHARPKGLFVLDWPGKKDVPSFEGLELLKQKNYGDAQLAFYRKTL